MTLDGPGTIQRIYSISAYAVGTVTAFSIEIHKNDGTTRIVRIGGQVGGAATGPMGPYVWDFTAPINCAVNDNAKVTLTATGASAVTINVNYKLSN